MAKPKQQPRHPASGQFVPDGAKPGGARHPGRPETQTAAQRAGKSGNGAPPMAPDYQAPEPGPRPKVTAPIPEHTRPRTHEERNT